MEKYFLPSNLNANIERFVIHYNHHRYHESLSSLPHADVYFGRGLTILIERKRTKRNTINQQMSFTVRSAALLWRSGVSLILHSRVVKMSQILSLKQSA
jgi:hypothetical protein